MKKNAQVHRGSAKLMIRKEILRDLHQSEMPRISGGSQNPLSCASTCVSHYCVKTQ